MASLFPRWANTAFRVALILIVLLVLAILLTPMVYVRTPYSTGQFVPIDQPVEFDHRHHVRDDGIDCLFCHRSAEVAATASIPSTDVCMGCHAQIWNQSPLLEPVRRSYFTGQPIPWNRVHKLPDHVYFHHGIHTQAGIGCVVCHGRVDRMARVYRFAPLVMGWCLDCHRNPQEYLRAWSRTEDYRERTDFGSMWGATIERFEVQVPDDPRITYLTTCTACHR